MIVPIAFVPIGWPEMLIISVVALLIFGKRLPEVARSLGRGVVEFKRGLKDVEHEVHHSEDTPEPKQLSSSDQPKSNIKSS